MKPLAIEAIALYWPILTAVILALTLRVNSRERLGLLYAVLWNLATLPVLNGIAEWAGWWTFTTLSPRFGGLPLSLWIGWAALWGGLASVLAKKLPLWAVVTVMALLDLLTMPLLEPLLVLEQGWWIGEVLLIIGALLPGLFLFHWTAANTQLGLRTTLIATGFAILSLVHIPLASHSASWSIMLTSLGNRPPFIQMGTAILAIVFSILPILAVREFVLVGKGTPVPMDAPKILVTTGIYRHIRNPMQFGITLILVIEAILFLSPWIALSVFAIIVYSVGFARWSENTDLVERFGEEWENYRAKVPSWRFRL